MVQNKHASKSTRRGPPHQGRAALRVRYAPLRSSPPSLFLTYNTNRILMFSSCYIRVELARTTVPPTLKKGPLGNSTPTPSLALHCAQRRIKQQSVYERMYTAVVLLYVVVVPGLKTSQNQRPQQKIRAARAQHQQLQCSAVQCACGTYVRT